MASKFSYIDPTGLHDAELVKGKWDVVISLPWPPSINNYYGRRPRGGIYIKKEGLKFRQDVVEMHGRKANNTWIPIRILIDIYPPDKRKRDNDNILKAVCDSLEHAGIYKDDYLIFHQQVRKHAAESPGGIEIKIEGLR